MAAIHPSIHVIRHRHGCRYRGCRRHLCAVRHDVRRRCFDHSRLALSDVPALPGFPIRLHSLPCVGNPTRSPDTFRLPECVGLWSPAVRSAFSEKPVSANASRPMLQNGGASERCSAHAIKVPVVAQPHFGFRRDVRSAHDRRVPRRLRGRASFLRARDGSRHDARQA